MNSSQHTLPGCPTVSFRTQRKAGLRVKVFKVTVHCLEHEHAKPLKEAFERGTKREMPDYLLMDLTGVEVAGDSRATIISLCINFAKWAQTHCRGVKYAFAMPPQYIEKMETAGMAKDYLIGENLTDVCGKWISLSATAPQRIPKAMPKRCSQRCKDCGSELHCPNCDR